MVREAERLALVREVLGDGVAPEGVVVVEVTVPDGEPGKWFAASTKSSAIDLFPGLLSRFAGRLLLLSITSREVRVEAGVEGLLNW